MLANTQPPRQAYQGVPESSCLLDTVEDVEVAIGDIDWQIEQLIVHRSSLRSRRNMLLPMFRLPAEIFSRLFHECIAFHSGGPNAALQLLKITHICWYWRQVALDDPSLWTRPDFTHPPLGYAMVSRAQEMPLCLTFPYHNEGCGGHPQLFDALLSRKDKIQSLNISATLADIQDNFRPLLGGILPNIEQLQLSSPKGVSCLRQEDLPTSALCLQELILHRCIPPEKIDIFPAITRLSISNIYCARTLEHLLRLPAILSILEQLPQLTTFELSQSCVGFRFEQFMHPVILVSERRIEMTRLRELKFVDSTNQNPVGYLLESITSPLLERVHIRGETQELLSLSVAARWLRDWIGLSPQQSLHSLTLLWDHSNFRISCTLSAGTLLADPKVFDLHLNMASWSAVLETFFTQLVSCIIIPTHLMSDLTTLNLSAVGLHTIRPRWTYNINWKGFATLLQLEHITVDQIPCWSFLRFVGETQSAMAEATRFPALRSLTFRDVIMWEGLEGTNCEDEPGSSLISRISKWLRQRKSWNMPLQRLSFSHCYFLSTPRDGLAPLVTTLSFDPPNW